MNLSLSPRQRDVLALLYDRRCGSPSVSTIGAVLGVRSRRRVQELLCALRRHGLVTFVAGRPRLVEDLALEAEARSVVPKMPAGPWEVEELPTSTAKRRVVALTAGATRIEIATPRGTDPHAIARFITISRELLPHLLAAGDAS